MLNPPAGLYSHTLARLAVLEAVRGSFDDAQAASDFDAYWRFHLLKEHHRVHETRYQRHPQAYTLAA
jgi:hypothetical protein